MSEGPKGDSFVSLEQAFSAAKKQPQGETKEGVDIPEKINKKRRQAPGKDKFKTARDRLYEKQVRKQDEITAARIAKEEAYEKELSEKKLGEQVFEKRRLREVVESSPEAHEIVEGLPSGVDEMPKITAEQFQEGVKRKNITDYVPGEDGFFSDVEIEPDSKRSKKPVAIVDAEILNEDGNTEDPKKEVVGVSNESILNNQDVTEVTSQDKTEIKTEETKKKKPKSAVELAMEKTQGVANEYNEKKLKKEDISKAKYIDDLLAAIDSSEGLQGSREYFDKDKLRMIVEMVRDGQLGYEYLTRSGGLRQKVFDILNKTKKVAKPKAEQPKEESIESEKEFVVEDAEQITPLPEDKTSGKVLKFENKNKRVGITKEGISPMLIEDVELGKQIRLQEREVGRVRGDYVFALKEYQNDFKKFSEAGPFKRFWMKITSAGERLNDAQAYSEQMKIEYRRQIDSLIEQKTELKFAEISSLRVNNPERKKYGKVTNADLINFINTRTNKALPEKFKNLSDQERWMSIDMKQIVAENILNKKEAEDLTEEIIKLEIKKEIADEVARDEKNILDRKLAEGL